MPVEYGTDMPLGTKRNLAAGGWHIAAGEAATVIATLDTPVKAAGTCVANSAQFLTVATTNRVTMTDRPTRDMMVSFRGQVTVASGDDEVTVSIYKNGSAVTSLAQTLTTSSSVATFDFGGVVTMGYGDYIEVYLTNVDTNANLTLNNGARLLVWG